VANRTATRLSRLVSHPCLPAVDARAFLRWPAHQIRWKIILPYAFLVIMLAAVGTYLSTSLLQGSLNDRFQNQLLEAGRVSSDAIVRQEDAHLSVARSVAFTQGLPQAIEAADEATVRGIITAIAANTATERIDVLNATGARIAGTHLADRATLTYGPVTGDDPASWTLTSLVLNDPNGAKYALLVGTSNGSMLVTASPVFDGDRLVGAVLVATSLQTLVNQMKAQALAEVTVYDFNGHPIASTFVLDASQADLTANANVLSSFGSGQTVRESRQIWHREYDLAYGELVVQGHAVGYYSAALSSDFIFSSETSARWKMTLLFGVGMAAVLGVGFVLAGSFTRRIRRLVTTAEAVTAGNLMARTPVGTGDDELDKLAHCLNRMTDRLEGQYMATMRALASAVAGNNPYTVRHSLRVGELATSLGRHLGVDELTLAQLEIGGYLHDVGKIGIRDTGLMVLDSIAPPDRAFIDTHPHIGVEAPDTTSIRNQVTLFIGVEPHGDSNSLAGDEQFAIVGRIVAVADLYDALTADRPDGPPMSSDEALALVRLTTGHLHFGTVEALAHVLPEWERSQGRGSDYARLRE
jgi:HD-GYP domain-containing protein (c-di-GMP phosphodiesterase class II)